MIYRLIAEDWPGGSALIQKRRSDWTARQRLSDCPSRWVVWVTQGEEGRELALVSTGHLGIAMEA